MFHVNILLLPQRLHEYKSLFSFTQLLYGQLLEYRSYRGGILWLAFLEYILKDVAGFFSRVSRPPKL